MTKRSGLRTVRCWPGCERTFAASSSSLTLCALLVLLLSASAAAANPAAPVGSTVPMAVGVSVDFLWQPERGNDTQVYLHVSNVAFKAPRSEVGRIYRKVDNPESNFPVLLFMAAEANVSLSKVWRLRSQGMSWVQVMAKLDIPPQRVFLDLGRPPGPPYGKAYGHWKKNPHKRVTITDDDVHYWVNIHAISRYFGVRPAKVVEWRNTGKTWKALTGVQYRQKRHPKLEDKEFDTAGMDGPKPGNSKSKGKAKGHRR